jgi:uncharacterized protein involved in exopolysaccharide biosynthesis
MEKLIDKSRPGSSAAPELSFVGLMAVVLKNRRLIIGLPLMLVLVAVVATLVQRRQYTATASFMPRASDASRLAGLGGLAAQMGVNLPTGDPGQSPDFYADLLYSREILGALVDTTYQLSTGPGAGKAMSFAALFEIDGDTPGEQREEAIRALTRRLSVTRNLRTGVIQVGVRTPWPELSRVMAQRVLDLVNDFNLRQRQARAAAERQFAEERLHTIRLELYQAEETLADFQRRNRAYRGSPDLSTEYERLSRAVSMRQQMFTSFSQLYEQARIDAVRNTPLIMVLDRPVTPARPDSRRGVLRVLLSLLAGGAIALLIAFARESTSAAQATAPADFARFQALRKEASDDLRRPWRLVLPRKGGAA